MKEKLAKLIDVKSIVTIAYTVAMVLLLTGTFTPTDNVLALFSTGYGAVMTYYFTRKE